VANTQKLIVEDDVFALFCYVGTPTTVKIIPIVEEAKVPLVGMFTGANALREPINRYIINVRASYYQETGTAVKHLVEDLGIRKIAIFYQYDAYGFDGLKGTEIALKGYGLAPVARGTYFRGTLDVEEGLDKIIGSGAEAVIMIGTYDPCAKFIRLSKDAGFNPLFHNVSFVGAEELARKLGKEGEGVIVSQVVPPPELPESRTLLWGALEYAELLKAHFPGDEPNFVGLEGFINAKVLVEGLKRAGWNLDRERFIDAIESINNHDIGIANTLSFSPTDHQGLERVYFTRIENGRFVLVTDWQRIKRELQVPGVTATTIIFGSSLTLQGPLGARGNQTLKGALAHIKEINEQGGVHGRKIRLIAYDDGNDPARSIDNTSRLIHKERVFGLFSYGGAATQQIDIISGVEEDGVPLFGVSSGDRAWRSPFRNFIFNIRASHEQEISAAAGYLVKELGMTRIAVWYQDDSQGREGINEIRKALGELGLSPLIQVGCTAGGIEMEKGLSDIMASGAEAVIFMGEGDSCLKFIRLAHGKGLGALLLHVSSMGADELVEKLGPEGEGVVLTQVVPPPVEGFFLPAISDYLRLLTTHFPGERPSVAGFEGFLNARVLVEVLRRAGREITRQGFIEAIKNLDKFYLGIGARVRFGPVDHQGLDKVYFTRIQGGRLVLMPVRTDADSAR
jgi:ABC-type branched-subunit amino acid transport system substrate-binding protein